MANSLAVMLTLGVLLALMVVRVPVAFSLFAAGIVGLLATTGVGRTEAAMASLLYSSSASYSLFVIPMFILMGLFVLKSRLAEDLFALSAKLLAWLPGGLAIATIGACAGFAAVTGSSVATVATMGRLSVDEMERYGYSRTFAAGVVGSAGTLGVLIPPSIVLVLYGIVTGESIGRLLIGGIIPGIISAAAYMGLVVGMALWGSNAMPGPRIKGAVNLAAAKHEMPSSSPEANPGEPAGTEIPEKRSSGTGVAAGLQVLMVFGIVVGGIYSGYFTATESGAMGAFVALILLLHRAATSLQDIVRKVRDAVKESMSLTAMAFAILVGATFFSQFLVVVRLPTNFANAVAGLDVDRVILVALLLLILIPLGMLLDGISIVVIAAPLLYAPITGLGYSGVWFGIMMVKFIELGLVTPPVGMNAYVVAGTIPGIKVEQVFRGLAPFIAVDVVVIALLFAFPTLVTWLPDRMI